MSIKLRSGGVWKNVNKAYLRSGGVWKNITKAYIRSGGVWKSMFGFISNINDPSIAQKVDLSQSTNSGLITLTGTNYYWTNASSLAYVFQRSSNGGSSWATISSGTATNPSLGSSNTETYQLKDNKSDLYPNVDNLYRFTVTATSAGGSTTPSTSDNQSVSAARDISNLSVVTADTTYDSVKLQFTAGAYSSSYFVRYTYSDGTAPGGTAEGYFRSAGSGSPTTTITVTGLSASTPYTFYVTPYTGGISSGSNTGYGGNESSSVSETTSAVLTPVQTSSPSLSGTGVAFTSITAASGSYQSGTFGSITTKIVYYLSPYTAPTDGEVSSSATIMDTATPVPTHPISQVDATIPNKKFYARDAVTSSNGATTYYYYSPVVTARVGTVTDNFNRTVASGLGTSSSSYIYSAVVNQATSSWSTNGSVAVNSTNLTPYNGFPNPGSGAVEYPIQALELTSKTDLTASVEIPSGGGGPGVAFWISGAGSFYAVAPSYYQTSSSESVTSTNCNGSVISTNSNGTIPNCYGCTVTTSTSGGTSSDCNATAFNTNSNGTSPNCYSCPVTTIPATDSSDCNFPVDKATDASGTGCFGCTVTTVPGSTSYSCGSGTQYDYSSYIAAQAACPSSCTISDTSYQTGPFTSTTYGCTGTTQNYSTLAACNASERVYGPYTAAMDGKRCSDCVQPIGGVSLFRASAVAATNTTYYVNNPQFSCTYSTTTVATTYTCRGRDTSTPVSYTCKGRDTSTPVVTSYSCTGQQVTNNVTTNTYYTQLRIMSTGYTSYVAVLKDQNINTNTSAFQKAYKVSVTTSGNTISATAYSDLSGTVLGTASYTRVDGTDLAKPATGASSYAGVIKTPSAINSGSVNNNAGSTYDNLSIT